MAKVISQETFDDVVRENVIEFEMSVPDAKEETVKQFEAQGINLANIIKDLKIDEETGKPVLNETIDKLKTLSAAGSDDVNFDELTKLLDILANECRASVPHRVVSPIIRRANFFRTKTSFGFTLVTFRWQPNWELMESLKTSSSWHWKSKMIIHRLVTY